MCFDLGQLQEYLDGESGEETARIIAQHLKTCSRCQERLEELNQTASLVSDKLEAWMEPLPLRSDGLEAVWDSINDRARSSEVEQYCEREGLKKAGITHNIKKVISVKSRWEVKYMLRRYRAAAVVAAVAMSLGIVLSFGPVREAAADFLAVFRVEKIKTVSIDTDDLRSIESALQRGGKSIDLEQFGKIQVTEDIEYRTATLEEAAAEVDFAVKEPGSVPEGFSQLRTYYTTPASASFTLQVDNVNKLLQSLKSESLLPAELDGKTFTLSIPASVGMTYGSDNSEKRPVNIVQSRSPELGVPDGVDLEKVREAMLGLPILPDNLRRQLAAVSDWQHTMLVPDVDGSTQSVTVQGVSGVVINSSQAASSDSTKCLMWVKDGVICVVQGGITIDQALEIANSLN